MPPRSIAIAGDSFDGELPEFASGRDVSREVTSARRERDFVLLIERNSRLMFRVAHSLLKHAEDAEDAVQEALLKLYRGEAWRRMEDERAFLARTVWRVALDRLPKRREQSLDSAPEPVACALNSPEARAVRESGAALLRRMIDALPEELRRVLVLSAIEELNSREIGEVLGIPEGTVRTRLMRAKDELRRRYEAAMGRSR